MSRIFAYVEDDDFSAIELIFADSLEEALVIVEESFDEDNNYVLYELKKKVELH